MSVHCEKVMDEKQVLPLWEALAKDPSSEAKNELVMHYLYVVNKVVLRMMPTYNNFVDYDDLVSCGVIGLMDAIDKFDHKLQTNFEGYAKKRVRGEIIDSLRKMDWASVSLRSRLKQLRDTEQELQSKLGRSVDDQDLARELDLPVQKIYDLKNQEHMFNLIHLESILNKGETSDACYDELLEDENAHTGHEAVEKQELKQMLVTLIDLLGEKERIAIQLYYYDELRIKEIAEVLGVSESRVSQLHSSALRKLREGMQKKYS